MLFHDTQHLYNVFFRVRFARVHEIRISRETTLYDVVTRRTCACV
jgi:hypothetical protein